MEFIRFILSGFWTWAGFLILIVAVGLVVIGIIDVIRSPRKIEAYRIGEHWHIQIEGARPGDIAETIRTGEVADMVRKESDPK